MDDLQTKLTKAFEPFPHYASKEQYVDAAILVIAQHLSEWADVWESASHTARSLTPGEISALHIRADTLRYHATSLRV